MSGQDVLRYFEIDALQAIMAETEKMANVGGWMWDIESDIWTFSDNWMLIHGSSSQSLTSSELLSIVHPDDQDAVKVAIEKAISSRSVYSIEYRILRLDSGKERHIRSCGKPVCNHSGKVIQLLGSTQDVTECKNAEASQVSGENRHKALMEYAGLGIGYWDLEGNCLMMNRRACKNMGSTPEQVIGRHATELFGKAMGLMLSERSLEVQRTRKVMTYEDEVAMPDGSLWYSSTYALIEDESGEPQGVQIISVDITEKVATEKSLKESEERLRGIIENMPVMMDAFNENYDIIAWNKECERVTGYSSHEMIRNPNALALLYPDSEYREKITDELEKLGLWFRDKAYTLTCKDGSKKTVSWSNISGEYSIPGWHTWAIGTDVTKNKKIEDSLRSSEQKYRHLIETASDAIYLISEKGRFIDVNQAACNMLGRTRDEILSFDIEGVDPNFSVEAFMHFWGETPLDAPRLFETKHLHSDGSLVPVELSGQKFKIGENIVFYGVARNITDRKKAQAERKELQLKLNQSQKMESIGNLAGGIAHDFNNILSAIIGFTELALDERSDRDSIDGYLQEVYSAGKRAKDLVKQILAFARQSDELKRPIKLGIIAKEVIKLIRSTISTAIEINQEIESSCHIMGSSTQVHQLLLNLCTNAACSMEESGGILGFSLRDVISNGDKVVEIMVSDTGSGIPPEIIDHIFEPYFTTKGLGEGTGMGLAMVQGVINSYGGHITVESEEGKGSIFTILLPTTDEQPADTPYEQENLPMGKERILFVDDEQSIADIGAETLGRLGYSVTSFSSSLHALEVFRENPFSYDLVVTDMAMPNLTGEKLTIEILAIRPDIPVILCTGYSKRLSKETSIKIGAKALVHKPVVIADMAELVRKVLDEAR